MSSIIYCTIFINVIFMFSCSTDVAIAARNIPSSVPSTMMPTSVDYVKTNPRVLVHSKHEVFNKKELFKGCMPKGAKHSSAPSRYVNYRTLGSSCATNKPHSQKP
ncbi:ATPase, AAA-type, CDC48 protein [Hibiscus syriacus]|uniref:ATPase, AAA-type, CDC48 protein n=1 Tax=Hibiscus syriacus TaxID=106335 RepID=A0A6A3B3T6_HIBSY|nr:ATPase, AAA-type, CDC48 protein [Hibiscus syriacus]